MRWPATDAGRLAAPVLAAGAAGGALAVQRAGAPTWIAVVLWCLALAVAVLDVVCDQAGDQAGGRVGGGSGAGGAGGPVARVLLVVVAAGWAHDLGRAPTAVVWAAVALLAVAIALEPAARRLMPRPDVASLAGVPALPGATVGWGGRPGLVAAAVGALVALASRWPVVVALVWVVVAVAAFAMQQLTLAQALVARRGRASRARAVRAALERHAPAFAIYTGRDDGGPHQVRMWLPYLERLGVPYVVVTRSTPALRALAAVTDQPVLSAASWRDLDTAVVPSLRAAFYVNAASTNTNFVGYRQLQHVYLGHGESDKALSYHPSHAMYDRVFVAGPAAIDRYRRHHVPVRDDAFVVVGRPQAERVTPRAADAGPPRTALYAPTWAGYNEATSHSSLAGGVALVRGLADAGLAVAFRPHPFSLDRADEAARVRAVDAALAEHRRATGTAHVLSGEPGAASLDDAMNASDLLVCDVSSVLADYLPSGKPLVVVAVGTTPAELVERHPMARAGYVVRDDGSDLPQALAALLDGDPLLAERERALAYYLGGLSGPAAVEAFVAAARAAVTEGGTGTH